MPSYFAGDSVDSERLEINPWETLLQRYIWAIPNLLRCLFRQIIYCTSPPTPSRCYLRRRACSETGRCRRYCGGEAYGRSRTYSHAMYLYRSFGHVLFKRFQSHLLVCNPKIYLPFKKTGIYVLAACPMTKKPYQVRHLIFSLTQRNHSSSFKQEDTDGARDGECVTDAGPKMMALGTATSNVSRLLPPSVLSHFFLPQEFALAAERGLFLTRID